MNVQHATWFRGCGLGLSGDRRLTVTAPNRCVADRIRAAYELELLRLFQLEAVDITVAVPPVANDSAFPLIEGRVYAMSIQPGTLSRRRPFGLFLGRIALLPPAAAAADNVGFVGPH